MTYAHQELEAEYNGRYDSVREAYAATAADAALMGNDDYGRAESEDNIRDMVAALLPTLSDDKVAKLEAWVEAQLPEVDENLAERQQGESESPNFAFRCVDCGKAFYHPHEGEFLQEKNPGSRCLDCDLDSTGGAGGFGGKH